MTILLLKGFKSTTFAAYTSFTFKDMEWILLLVGLVIGILAVYFLRVHALQKDKKQLEKKLEGSEEKLKEYSTSYTQVSTQCQELEKRLLEAKQEKESLFKRHENDFRHLAQQVLTKSREELNKDSLNSMLNVVRPLKEQLEGLQKENIATAERHGNLKTYIEELKKQSLVLGDEARALTRALQGSKAQGDFGEEILKMLLEQSGLREDEHYFADKHFTTEEGRSLRPDVFLRLPEQRALVIDSKISLQAYQTYVNSEGEAQDLAIKAHLNSIRNHVKSLKSKDYTQLPSYEKCEGLDYVLMFVPIEPAFLLALQKDRRLFEDAMKPPSVVLVSSTTLMATLRIIHYMWRQSDQQKYAQEIANTGGELYDKLVSFLTGIESVGKSLAQAQESYEYAHKRLTSERKGEIPELAARMRALGAAPKKELPSPYLPQTTKEIRDLPTSPEQDPPHE